MHSLRAALPAVLIASTACRHATPPPASHDASVTYDAAVAPPSPPPAPWCFTPRPLADLRAIDPRGHIWSIVGTALTDEGTGVVTPLPTEVPCPARGGWAMEFARDGSAFALVDSRFYIRPSRDVPFLVTAMCSDVHGAPWSPRTDGGWSFVARTWPANGPGMMLTNDHSGEVGWYAVAALDTTLMAAVLEPDRSMVMLANGGHLLFVDQTRIVAGEVLASHGALFSGLGRSVGGVVAWRDDGPTRRVVVTSGATVQQPFTEMVGLRPDGGRTDTVVIADIARLLAVTDHGVELSTDHGAHYTRVLDTPAPLERVTFGWIDGAHPALASRTGVASDHCLAPAPGH